MFTSLFCFDLLKIIVLGNYAAWNDRIEQSKWKEEMKKKHEVIDMEE